MCKWFSCGLSMLDVFLLRLDDSKDMQHTAYTAFPSSMVFLVTNSLGCFQEIHEQELLVRRSSVLQPDDFVLFVSRLSSQILFCV